MRLQNDTLVFQITNDILQIFRKPLQTFYLKASEKLGDMTLHPVSQVPVD